MSGRNIAAALMFALASIPLSHAGNQTCTRSADTCLLELPASVDKVTFTLIGAGGGGGHGVVAPGSLFAKGHPVAGGGGGGGATLICTLSIIPGSALLVTVGSGGKASAGGSSVVRIREPNGAISAFTFFADGGEGGSHARSSFLASSPGHGGRGGKGSTTPDCVMVEGFGGGDANAGVPGPGAAANPDEAARRAAILRGLNTLRREQTAANAADAARAALCKGAGTGGDGGVAPGDDGRPGSDGCVSVDY